MHIFGYPVGFYEPFSEERVAEIRREVNEYFKSDEKSILKSVKWNATCLTSSPDGHGRGDEISLKQPYHAKTPFMEAIHAHMRKYLAENGLEALNPAMFRCGDPDCEDCVRDAWFNLYRKGHYQDPHWHHGEKTGCVLGFVYFVQYDPEKDGRFIFINPAPDLRIEGLQKCPAFQKEFSPDVKEGTLMIFPAFMVHRVTKQVSNHERITFAGNFFCKTDS